MAKKIYIGVSGIARRVHNIFIGVNDVARKVKKVYIGVNGVARQCFPSVSPANLFTQSGGVNTSVVTSLSRNFQYQTSSGQNYTMTQMSRSGSSPNYYWSGSMSDSAGNAEKALYMLSSDDVTMTNYDRLSATFEYRYTKNGSSSGHIYFGAYKTNSSYQTCKSSELTNNFSAYTRFSPQSSSSFTEQTLVVDIRSITGNRRVLLLLPWANMNGNTSVRIKKLWLE